MKTVLPNADFVIEGYADPPSLRYDATCPLEKPKRCEGPFGDHTGPQEVRSLKCEVRIIFSQTASSAAFIPRSAFVIRHSETAE